MVDTTLTQIKSRLSGGGSRPNLFEIQIPTLPGTIPSWNADDFACLCKAGGLPASNVGIVEVPFRGRTFKVAGDRSFDTWTVTVIAEDNLNLRKAFEEWMQLVAQYGDGSGERNPNNYMKDATVTQFTRNTSNYGDNRSTGNGLIAVRQYQFKDIFPTNLSQIDLSYDSTDTITEFTVEFQVNYWYPTGSGATATSSTPTTTTTTTTP